MSIFETLSKLSRKKVNQDSVVNYSKVNEKQDSKRKDPSYNYLEDNQVKETKISELLDSSASVYINRTMNYESAKLIHEFMFG